MTRDDFYEALRELRSQVEQLRADASTVATPNEDMFLARTEDRLDDFTTAMEDEV